MIPCLVTPANRDSLCRLLQDEATDAMPRKEAREFRRFINSLNPPQGRLRLAKRATA